VGAGVPTAVAPFALTGAVESFLYIQYVIITASHTCTGRCARARHARLSKAAAEPGFIQLTYRLYIIFIVLQPRALKGP